MIEIIPFISRLPAELVAVLLAALPVTELRAALPFALTVLKLDPMRAFVVVFLGNLIPLGLIFAFLPGVVRFAESHSPWLKRVLQNYFRLLSEKHTQRFQRYGSLALAVFIMIPLPGSGVWTGSVLAILFNLRRSWAIPAIIIGLFGADVLVLLITQGVLGGLSFIL